MIEVFYVLYIMFKLKRRKNQENNFKICPKCKSKNLIKTYSGFTRENYHCQDCNYEGAFYLEINPEENGENFVNLEELKKLYPEDVDNETQIEVSPP